MKIKLQKNKNKISKNKKTSLEERFKNYKGKNLSKEFKWDESRGIEIW